MWTLHFLFTKNSNRFPTSFLGLALMLLILFLASPMSSCTEQESNSLLHFLAGLSQEGGLTKSWQNGTDCCTWEGITCSPDRMVTDVFLASRSLEGEISPFLGNLSGLLRLNLSYNLLSGVLPLELVSSSTIIVLDVSFNQLNGGLQELQSSNPLRPLQVLNISSNLFSGQFPSTTWDTMKSLVVLNFSGSIPPGLSNCSRLTSLSAGDNNLNGTLSDDLLHIALLEHLSFPKNQLEGSIGDVSKLKNLVTLNLEGNGFSGNIPDSISELTRLEEISLGNNNMSEELPSTLSRCTKLQITDLKSNSFCGELVGADHRRRHDVDGWERDLSDLERVHGHHE
ncbi:hypothetical protein SORBI_3004G129201 [Sorghum bicolor]|uniref:Leucine-rich repeat-containing N-terminal plant-type domain-containing protein n=1 Tax=Sorghum bicolor TaxID=4558 RepID=A0A1Z5RM45_SORBI|nr:hypothetical protein SORBI_3004G129201 [Sorghum bicolor]